MRVTIFLGPSMPVEDARRILPGATFRPPAAQGDLLHALDRDRPDVIGLIDGTFHQNLSVWHSEVCYLLHRGVAVYGASSMGALRAVETERYGMVGIGAVYRWYRDGVITGDDEVALLHGDDSVGFRPLSLPMVNIRASVSAAVDHGRLDPARAERLLEIARGLHYPERLVPLIIDGCLAAGFPDDQLTATRECLTTGYVDLKRSDANELLVTMAGLVDGSVPVSAPERFEFTRSAVFETLYNLDRQVEVGGRFVTLQDVAEHVALFDPRFRQIKQAALDRAIVVYVGALFEIEPTEEDLAHERQLFCEERGLDSPEAVDAWLQACAYCEEDLQRYLREEAVCRYLRRSALTARSFDRGAKALLDQLRFDGTFTHWAKETAEAAAMVETYRYEPEYRRIEAEDPARLAETHADAGHIRIRGDARIWAEDAGFDGVDGLADALRRAAIVDDVRARIARQMVALERAANGGLAGEV